MVTTWLKRVFVPLVVVHVAGAVAVPAVAVDEPRERPSETSPPVRIYVGETLDISAVGLSGGGTIGTDETTFDAVGGGPSFTVSDPTSADFEGVETGSYYVAGDADARTDGDADRDADPDAAHRPGIRRLGGPPRAARPAVTAVSRPTAPARIGTAGGGVRRGRASP